MIEGDQVGGVWARGKRQVCGCGGQGSGVGWCRWRLRAALVAGRQAFVRAGRVLMLGSVHMQRLLTRVSRQHQAPLLQLRREPEQA
jgi:hypothetical protein